jgi:hypothetical protein
MDDIVPHCCTNRCRCPVHQTPLIYWPGGDDHACQDADCEYAHGFKPAEPKPPGRAVLDTQAILMYRYHPDLKNLGGEE